MELQGYKSYIRKDKTMRRKLMKRLAALLTVLMMLSGGLMQSYAESLCIDDMPHELEERVTVTEPTTKKDGKMVVEFFCTVCEQIIDKATEILPKLEEETDEVDDDDDDDDDDYDEDVSGQVTVNRGKVLANTGSIGTNLGYIEENYGTIEVNKGSVQRQYYNMNTRMTPGDYSISYTGFIMKEMPDGTLRCYLGSGASGTVKITPKQGKKIDSVVWIVNGQEIPLEDLGNGFYRIQAPGWPQDEKGFALNEGTLSVRLADDPVSAGKDVWQTQIMKDLEHSFGYRLDMHKLLENAGSSSGIRVEGMSPAQVIAGQAGDLRSRGDILEAMANALYSSGDAPLSFMLEKGVRINCTQRALRELMQKLMPKVKYEEVQQTEDEARSALLEEMKNSPAGSAGYYDATTYQITFRFTPMSERVEFEQTPDTRNLPKPREFNDPD